MPTRRDIRGGSAGSTSLWLVAPRGGTPWPDGLLDAEPGRVGDVEAPVVGPRAQIEIKRMMPVWGPSRPRRAKDIEDVARLEAALRGR
ncbi:hypothetical protein ACH47Z_09965 [Streptomyces sp. NPDC020192]|uniref:hypothetical protein n=1 Tax=Streptomyces sp. NPDC020192 TaxID=3365066 RepID=UPI0037A1C4DE